MGCAAKEVWGLVIISTHQICGSHLSPTRYGVRPEFIECGGWPGYVAKFIQPDIDWGCRRVLLHNPFSAIAGAYQFDQYIDAENAGLLTVEKFVPTIAALVKQGIEVIAYLGTKHDDPSFERLKAPGKSDDYQRRDARSIRPILEAGCSLAFDHANDYAPGSIELASMEYAAAFVRNHGGRAYIEPAPQQSQAHMSGWPSLTQDRIYLQRVGQWCDTKAEVIRWVDDGPAAWTAEMLAERFKTIRGDGHTPAGIVGFLREAGYKASDFQ